MDIDEESGGKVYGPRLRPIEPFQLNGALVFATCVGVHCPLAIAMFEYAEFPLVLKARTRYRYHLFLFLFVSR